MLHNQRIWSLSAVVTAEELAHKLTHYTWTGCQSFQLNGYIFANDSTAADGAQEYAVLKRFKGEHELLQVESITFSWCDEVQSLALILRIADGELDSIVYGRVSSYRFQTVAEHGLCQLCVWVWGQE